MYPAGTDRDVALEVEGVTKVFRSRRTNRGSIGEVHALRGVSLHLEVGETLGLVGESGSGKTTLGRILIGLERPTQGRGSLWGKELFTNRGASNRSISRSMQMVFQDPYGSLDPRMTIFQHISEPWQIHRDMVPREQWRSKVQDLMEQVGLDPGASNKSAHEFSGGQRQRIGIARALAINPRILILDEPVSALDVSIQAQIIELLRKLQDSHKLSMIFIAHNLAVVRSIAHRVAVMSTGSIVEMGDADSIYANPQHEYTRSLLAAVPRIDYGRAGQN